MVDLSTRSLAGIGLMILGTAMFGLGLVPSLSALSAMLALAAALFTVGTYLVGTDVPGQVV
jgi:hypothetical protein